MARMLVVLAIVAVVAFSLCYIANRACSAIEASSRTRANEHATLVKDHAEIKEMLRGLKDGQDQNGEVIRQNNEMLKTIYGIATRSPNPEGQR